MNLLDLCHKLISLVVNSGDSLDSTIWYFVCKTTRACCGNIISKCDFFTTLASYEYLNLFFCAHKNGCLWSERTCAASCNLNVLKWFRSQGCPWDAEVCIIAAGTGNLEMLKWAICEGCPCPKDICFYAARSGDLATLKWCVQSGHQWDGFTSSYAAQSGNLTMLKWCFSNGCEFLSTICNDAVV